MLDCDVATCGRIERQRYVARREHLRRRGTHVETDDDVGVGQLQPSVVGEAALRAHSGRGEHEVTVDGDTVVQPYGVVVQAFD